MSLLDLIGSDRCDITAIPPPNGGEPDFVNPSSLTPTILGVQAVLTIWGITFTSIRFWVNRHHLAAADWLNLFALVTCIVLLGYQGTLRGTTLHFWDVPLCKLNDQFAISYFIQPFLVFVGSAAAKCAILLLYRQLFGIKQSMRIAIWVGLVFTIGVSLYGIAIDINYQTPRNGQWIESLFASFFGATGRETLLQFKAQGGLTIVLDLYLSLLPLPVISVLKLPLHSRIQLAAVFSLALVGIGADTATVVVLTQISGTGDSTWQYNILSLCRYSQLGVATIVGSAPAVSSFARTHSLDWASLKSIFEPLSHYGSRSKLSDAEADLGPSQDWPKSRNLDNHATHGSGDQTLLDRTHPYIELSEAEHMKSWAASEQRRSGQAPVVAPENGILKTVAFEARTS